MDLLDRSVAVIKPKAPFVAWLNALPATPLEFSLEMVQTDCTVLLIPAVELSEEGISAIDQLAEEIFEAELTAWEEDKQLWPPQRDLKTFWEWFEVEIHQAVVDTVEDPTATL